MIGLTKLIGKAVGRPEIDRAARAQRVLSEWTEMVGPELASRSSPERFERGTVWVAVEGSAWAQELRLAKREILGRLAERSGDSSLITDMRFGVRPVNPQQPPVVKPTPPPREPDSRSIREIAEDRLRNWGA